MVWILEMVEMVGILEMVVPMNLIFQSSMDLSGNNTLMASSFRLGKLSVMKARVPAPLSWSGTAVR